MRFELSIFNCGKTKIAPDASLQTLEALVLPLVTSRCREDIGSQSVYCKVLYDGAALLRSLPRYGRVDISTGTCFRYHIETGQMPSCGT